MIDNIRQLGPSFVVCWTLAIGFTLLKPQRYFNSFLLMFAILDTLVFIAGFSDTHGGEFLFRCGIMIILILLLVPAMLIMNGIVMLRRESLCPAHLLSLLLGLIVGGGELAAIFVTFGLNEYINIAELGNRMIFLSVTVFYFSYLILCFVLYSLFIQIMPHRMDFDYVIIHGCGLADGERLTKLLSDRVDKAIRIYNKCRVKPVIIPSGGRGSDEKISEAEAMKRYLMEHGIPEDSIVTEDSSDTTRENLINSKRIIDSRGGSRRIALISSNYHIYRCLRIADSVGLSCVGIGARVAWYYWPSALIREFAAIFLKRGFFIWSMLGYLLFISPFIFALR